jgi:hypothetical protein
MTFTGRIGTQRSQLGNIVLGIVDSFGLGAFGFVAHVLTSTQIRVLFSTSVTEDTALISGNYLLTSLAPPGSAVTPTIVSVEFYDETQTSVVLNCSQRLTYGNMMNATGTMYSLSIMNVQDNLGEYVSSAASNFIANVKDPPRIQGACAYLSRRGCVDITFDRSVGPTSVSATANIRDAAGGPGVAMTLQTWGTELLLPDTSLRFALPPGMATADAYLIDFANVVDESLNIVSGTTEFVFTLRSPTPYTYADFNQLQLIDAFVVDVSDDFIMTGTVRVYFNCPVLNSDITTNWTATQPGPHPGIDTVDSITTPNAMDLPTVEALANSIKSNLNAHYTLAGVHSQNDIVDTILSPNAVDLPTSITLLNEAQAKFLNHLSLPRVHIYNDTASSFVPIIAVDLATSIIVANQIKTSFNLHLTDVRNLAFSNQYSPIPEILDFAHLTGNQAFIVDSAYTYYADLHLTMNSNLVPVTLTATLTSEDGGSVTNPGDYTGSIIARQAFAPAKILTSTTAIDSSVSINSDREIRLTNTGEPQILRSDGTTLVTESVETTTSIQALIWALNQLIYAYSLHINASPTIGAGHQATDTTNTVNVGNYVLIPSLSAAIAAANTFYVLLDHHMQSSVFHFQADNDIVVGPLASDISTLSALVSNIRTKFLAHNIRIGPHSSAGWKVYGAPLFDTLVVNLDTMVDSSDYTLTTNLRSVYHDNAAGDPVPGSPNRVLGAEFTQFLNLSVPFLGSATYPSLASALPRIGIVDTGSGIQFESDTVEVFFSKPMRQVPLNQTNLFLMGGSIVVGNASWNSPNMASIVVSNMSTVSYSLEAIGLTDEAGNVVYP